MEGSREPVTAEVADEVGIRDLIRSLAGIRMIADDAGLIDQLRDLEELKSAVAGLQARIAVTFDARQRQKQADPETLSAEDLGKDRGKDCRMDSAAQIALARGESPHRGGRLLGMARALVTEMPHTLAALETGQLNEERATMIVRETACLSAADRSAADEELAADTGTFKGAGTRAIVAAARAAAIRRDSRSVTQRASRAASERTVSIRPAPDTMVYLTALLPVHEGIAVYTALTRHADSLRAGGDQRNRGQISADTLVEWTTGTPGGISGVDVHLVMTDRTLFQGDTEPARIAGYGVVPAAWARTLVTSGQAEGDQEFKAWVRRLYRLRGRVIWWPWIRGGGCSRHRCAASSKSVTTLAGRPTATLPSGTSTT